MKNKIDINCDLGEGKKHDERIMHFISSANIACGYHAGDPETIKRTIYLCLKHNVAIGAHPSFDDKHNFGRTEIKLGAEELYDLVTTQIQLINKIAIAEGGQLVHVKPHGALYNLAARDPDISATIVKAIKNFNGRLVLYGLSGSHMITEAKRAGLMSASEVFADRTYQSNGNLTPRSQTNALINNTAELKKHILKIIKTGHVLASDGTDVALEADTICIHGDGHHAVEFAELLHSILLQEGITISHSFNE